MFFFSDSQLANADEGILSWEYIDEEGDISDIALPQSSVVHDEFFFYGLDEEILGQFRARQEAGRKKGEYVEIPAVGIRSKFSQHCFVAGNGVQITKANIGSYSFFIVAVLWTSNDNFGFLLMEKEEFLRLDTEESIDKQKQGN